MRKYGAVVGDNNGIEYFRVGDRVTIAGNDYWPHNNAMGAPVLLESCATGAVVRAVNYRADRYINRELVSITSMALRSIEPGGGLWYEHPPARPDPGPSDATLRFIESAGYRVELKVKDATDVFTLRNDATGERAVLKVLSWENNILRGIISLGTYLKEFPTPDEYYKRQARLWRKVADAGFGPKVYDTALQDGRLYIVMEFLPWS